MAKAKRALVIGLDGMDPKYVKRFSEEGLLPNMTRLIRQGAFGRLVSVPPAQTPANWTSIATGAWPGTHNVVVWGAHAPGKFPANLFRAEAMSSNVCGAEYLWEAAARAGKGSVLMNFVGYPPTAKGVVHIDWFQNPGGYFFEIAPAQGFRTGDVSGGLEADSAKATLAATAGQVTLRPAQGWKNLPASTSPLPAATRRDSPLGLPGSDRAKALSLQPAVSSLLSTSKPALEGEVTVVTKEPGTPVTYHLLLLAGKRGYDRVLIAKSKDARRALATLRPGEWSDWLWEDFTLDLPVLGRKRKRGALRWRLIELSPDGRRLWLYHPHVIAQKEFVSPKSVGKELVGRFGPFINEAGWSSYIRGLADEATLREEFAYFARWVGRAASYLMGKRGVVLYMQQLHLLDHLNHRYLEWVDPFATGYSPEREAEGWQKMRLGYQLADEMVGEVAKAVREDGVAFVVADHADTPNRRAVALANLFRSKGWLAVKEVRPGRYDFDYSKTKLYFDQLHIYVNLKGREPEGVVEPAEYDSLRDAVIDELLALHDPKDARRAIPVALRKEDALYFGVWGPGGGDIFFMYGPGFRWCGLEVLSLGEERIFFDCTGANHGPQITTAETAMSTNSGGFIAAGPGIRRGYARLDKEVGPAFTVDVAPTVAHLVGIPQPAQCQGKVIFDILAGGEARIRRRRKAIRFPVPARRPAPAPKPQLKGDVTDET